MNRRAFLAGASVPLLAQAQRRPGEAIRPPEASEVALRHLRNVIQLGPSAMNLASAATALEIAFGSFRPSDIAQLEARIKESGFLEYGLSVEIAIKIASGIVAATGKPVDSGEILALNDSLPVLRDAVYGAGCAILHQNMVSLLYRAAGGYEVNAPVSSSGADSGIPICPLLGILGLYSSVWGVMGTMGYLPFLAAGPGAVIFAFAGVAMAIAGLYC
jgi:hypothetical protein